MDLMYLRQEKKLTLAFSCKECSQNRLLSTCVNASREVFSFEPVEIVTSKTRPLGSLVALRKLDIWLLPHLKMLRNEKCHMQQSRYFWSTFISYASNRFYERNKRFKRKVHQRNVIFFSFVSISASSRFSSLFWVREINSEKNVI